MGGDAPHFDMQDYLINWNAGPFGLVLRPDLGSDMPPCVVSLLPEQSVAKLSGVQPGDLLISVNGKKTAKLGYEKVVKMLYKESLPVILHFRTPNSARPAPVPRSATDTQQLHADDDAASQRSARQRGHSNAPTANQSQDFDTRSTASSSSQRQGRVTPRSAAAPTAVAATNDRKQFTAVWEAGSLGMSFRPYSARVNVPVVDFIGARGRGRNMDRVCVNDVLIAINGEKTKTLGVDRVLRWLLVIDKPAMLRFHCSSNRVVVESSRQQPERERETAAPQPQPQSRLQILYEPPVQQQRERRMTSHAMPREPSSTADASLLAYEFNGNGAAGRTDLQQQRRESFSTRPRTYSNSSVSRSLSHGLAPPPSSPSAAFGSDATAQYVSTDRVLFDPETLRERRYSNTPSAVGRSHTTTTTDLSHDDAVLVVARASGKPLTECMFGGTPVLSIREGSVQAKLLRTFARACLAREADAEAAAAIETPVPSRRGSNASARTNSSVSASADAAAGDFTRDYHGPPLTPQSPYQTYQSPHQMYQSPHQMFASPSSASRQMYQTHQTPTHQTQQQQRFTAGNTLGRHHSQQYMSFGFDHEQRARAASSDAAVGSSTASSPLSMPPSPLPPFRAPRQPETVAVESPPPPPPPASPPVPAATATPPASPVVEPTPPTPAATTPASPAVSSAALSASPVSSTGVAPALALDALQSQLMARTASEHAVTGRSAAPAPSTSATSSSDMISLNDFVVQHDGRVSDRTTASSVTSASTHVYSLHSEDDLLAVGSHLVAPAIAAVSSTSPPSQDDDAVEATASVEVSDAATIQTETAEIETAETAEIETAETDADVTESEMAETKTETKMETDTTKTESATNEAAAPRVFDVLDQRVLSSTDINIAPTDSSSNNAAVPLRSDMISLSDLAALLSSTGGIPEAELRHVYDPVQREIDAMTHVERSSLLHPLIAEMYGFLPDLHNVVKDKPVDSLLMKKGMVDEIQDILQSLQMEAQFERHSHLGVGLHPPSTTSGGGGSSTSASLDAVSIGSSALPPRSPEPTAAGNSRKRCCYQCGKPGELADLALEGGRRELYCQDCWDVFFDSEDRVDDGESITPRSFRDSADDAFKYSFHDSAVSRSDMIGGPWRYHNNGDSASSIRDSTTTIGSNADEVWL